MKRKIVFFINPVSGVKSKTDLEKTIIDKCEKEKVLFEILLTSRNGDYSFLREKIQTDCVSDVVICGGDGSVAPIVTALLNLPVNVGIIPLGSGNGLARTAGIPKSVKKSLDIIFSGNPMPVDAFMVNERLGCQITGFGFDAFIAHEFARERKRGLSTYTKLAVKHFLKAKPFRFEIEHSEGVIVTKAFIVCVSNANQFGNNVKIAPQASLCDGLLDVVILNESTKLGILSAFANHLLFSKKSPPVLSSASRKKVHYFNTNKIRIKNPDNAPVHIDGDPLDELKECVIEILPAAFSLIHPR